MSFFPLPAGVANCIEKLQRDFLLGVLSKEFKYHLVSKSKICSPIFEGGLEVWNLLIFNHALLGKHIRHYVLEKEAWWRVVVDSIYGSSWRG
jgi:hypothetical protein